MDVRLYVSTGKNQRGYVSDVKAHFCCNISVGNITIAGNITD